MRLAVTTFVALLAGWSAAAEWQFGTPCCERCGGTCVLEAEQIESEEACYDVICEEVCIPAVTLPWEDCRVPKCGRSRVVARLKHSSRPKTVCEYKWLPVCPRCGSGHRSGSQGQDIEKTPPAPSAALSAPEPAAGTAHRSLPRRGTFSRAGSTRTAVRRTW